MWFVPFLFGILVATIFLWTLRLFGHFEEIVHDFMTSIQNFNQFGLQQNSVMLNRTSTFSRMILGQGRLQTSNVAFYQNKIPSKLKSQLETPNVAFYENKIPAKPNDLPDDPESLKKDLGEINYRNGTLKWLFPNRMPGTNKDAHVLTDKEVTIFQETPELRNRVKKSFEMMLDFYGMKLTEENQIQLKKGSNKRLKVLNKMNNHNFLCITRILLALKELGHCKLMCQWMKCLADLIYNKKQLHHAKFSFESFWLDILDVEDQRYITSLIKKYSV